MTKMTTWLNELLLSMGLNSEVAGVLDKTIILLVIIALAFLIQKICKRIVLNTIVKLVRRTKVTWDDIIFDPKVMGKLIGMIAPVIVYLLAPAIFAYGSSGLEYVQRFCMAYIIAMFIRFLSALLTAFYTIYN